MSTQQSTQARAEGAPRSIAEVAARIQHTNVRADATRGELERLLAECLDYGFHAATVNPVWLPLAVKTLEGSSVRVCTALDYPIGGETTATVVRATAEARQAGAHEIDVMTKVGWLKSAMDVAYRQHLAAVVKAAEGIPVKAILETTLLTAHELALAVELCADAGVAYVKNSSGFDGGLANPKLIGQLAKLASGRMKVKAAGGIRTFDQAVELLEAGADLLGTTSGASIAESAPVEAAPF
jgi:deoxyribose-phosphate aldolase